MALYSALLTSLALPLLYLVYILLLSPLASIPGPFAAKFSRFWLLKHSRDGDMHRTMIRLHARHGDLVRTGPNEVSVAELSAIKKIYGAGTKFRKSDWYSVWQGRRKFDLFPERDEQVHRSQRRLVSGIYAMNHLVRYEGRVDETVEMMMKRMGEVGKGGKEVVNLGNWLQLFAFDVVGMLTFSKMFGFMEKGEDDGSFRNIEGALRSASWVGQVPWLYWMNDWLTPVIGNRLGIAARHGSIRAFAAREVEARKEKKTGKEEDDILARLFEVHKEKPEEFPNENVLSMATSNVFAGSDTTAISLRSIIYYLLKNPESKEKLIKEIDKRRQTGKLSDPVKLEEANDMPYLQACMYEALRLHPAVGMSLPRVVPKGGIEIAGKYLPKDTIVGVNPWVVHRNEEVFGEDVEGFKPERWLREGKDSDMIRFFFAFGSGARMCLGRNISWMEMSKLIPTLFTEFDLSLAYPKENWKETCWWFVKQDGLNVRLIPR
jgi:cytochrome P450